MTTASAQPFERIVVDVVYRPTRHGRVPISGQTAKQKAAELHEIQAQRAKLAAREAELILAFAADRPDDDDPAPGTPGARSRNWRPTEPEFPGVSEAFPHELAMVLNVGRGTAAHKMRRALTWQHSLPLVADAQHRGQLDERRAQIFADTLAYTDPAVARRVEAIVLPEARELGFGGLKRRILTVLLELDPCSADENRTLARDNADVFVEAGADGMATLGASLPADEAAEGYDFIDTLAQMAKADGDPRPIGRIRTEVYSLLVRGAALADRAGGVRAALTITAALDALEGSSTAPGDVNGFAITPAHLRELLHRIGALGLEQPDGGSVAFALTDESGRLVATRDQTCRFPNCGQRVGWADLDHVLPHACGGETDCANLCCLCRSHHRLKTFAPGWRFVMDTDGTLHVTTPSGVTRTTRPPGLRPRPDGPPARTSHPPASDGDPPPF